jgi:redox-sensitive bicupin YhaK (pirin superfamily)
LKKIIHKADSRGYADHGWLKSRHSFSFANYYDPKRIQFGLLRVLNDDIVEGGMGFGTHPHDNMEIVSIPLKGDLAHRDSAGHHQVIRSGDVQIMSAGSGIAHSEYNHSEDLEVNFLQIWVFPKERNIQPRYEQKTFPVNERHNRFLTVVSPEKADEALWINQDAFFSLGRFDEGQNTAYTIRRKKNGIYLFVIEGQIAIDGNELVRRDAVGVTESETLQLKVMEPSEILILDVPMN